MKKTLCVILALALCLGLCCAVAESSALPAYVYPFAEENPLMAGVMDCLMKTDFGYEPAEGTVMIPAPIVLKTEMNADETEATVWGNFWMFGYRLNGKILEATCGGDNPGVMKLVKQDGAWTAVSLEVAPVNGDRGRYLKEFSGGDEALEKEYEIAGDAVEGYLPQYRRSFIVEYVNANHLDIEAFQDPGKEPVDVKN